MRGLFGCILLELMLRLAPAPLEGQVAFLPSAVHVDGVGKSGWLQLVSSSSETLEVALTLHFGYPITHDDGRVSVTAPGELPDTALRSAVPWLRFAPDRVVLEPGASQRVRFVVPNGPLPPGEYWARLTLHPQPVTATPLAGPLGDHDHEARPVDTIPRVNVRVRSQVAIPVFLRSGPVTARPVLDSITVKRETNRVRVRPWLSNLGQGAALGFARIELIDGNGQSAGVVERQVAVYDRQSPEFVLAVAPTAVPPLRVRFSLTDQRPDLADHVHLEFAAIHSEIEVPRADGGAVDPLSSLYSLQFEGIELGVIEARLDPSPPHEALFSVFDVSQALGIGLDREPGSAILVGRSAADPPLEFTLDLDSGLGNRGMLAFDVSGAPYLQHAEGIWLPARTLATLFGVGLRVDPALLALRLDAHHRQLPRFASRQMRTLAGPGRTTFPGRTELDRPELGEQVASLRQMWPRRMSITHALGLQPSGQLVVTFGLGLAVLGGGMELRGAPRVGAARGPDAANRAERSWSWRWELTRPSSSLLTRLRLGEGPAAGPWGAQSAFGVMVSNALLARRSDLGADQRQGITDPGVEVQLWLSGRLVDATVADTEGRWQLDLPLRAGETTGELVFLRSDGVYREPVFVVTSPEMLPARRFEYSMSLDTDSSKVFFSRCLRSFTCSRFSADLRWAPRSRLTLQAGVRREHETDGEVDLRSWFRVTWAPTDRWLLAFDQMGLLRRAETSLRVGSALAVFANLEREAGSGSRLPAPQGMIASGPRASRDRRHEVRIETRTAGRFGGALGFETSTHSKGRSEEWRGRIDLRAGGWLARISTGARVDRARETGRVRVTSSERLSVAGQLPRLGVPGVDGLRLSAQVKTFEAFGALDEIAIRTLRSMKGQGQLDLSARWGPLRPLRMALGVRASAPFARWAQVVQPPLNRADGWHISTTVSGSAVVSRHGIELRRDPAQATASLALAAFVDSNGDSKLDANEMPLEGVVMRIGRREAVTVGSMSQVRIADLPPGVPLAVEVDTSVTQWDSSGQVVEPVQRVWWITLGPYAEAVLEVPFRRSPSARGADGEPIQGVG